MENNKIKRRTFVRNTMLTATGVSIGGIAPLAALGREKEPFKVPIRWIDEDQPNHFIGNTWGVPWKMGALKDARLLRLKTGEGNEIPVQSWPLAWWGDGSIKWTAHAISPSETLSLEYFLEPGKPLSKAEGLNVKETIDGFLVDTGLMQCAVNKTGSTLIEGIFRKEKMVAKNGKLVLRVQNAPELLPGVTISCEDFTSQITSVRLEQAGPLRAVIKIEGKHASANRALMPFVVRLYFFAGSEAIRMMHTIVYDGNENKDFISGLGMHFEVPLEGEAYNRHIRFAGQDGGIFSEAAQTLTGLRRDPGKAVKDAQVNGKKVGPLESLPGNFPANMKYVPVFGDYSLTQLTPDSFGIKKRTGPACGWVQAAMGKRSQGTAYIGTPEGGLAFGLRNFWQSHPAQLDIRNANTNLAGITLWFWAPEAPPMDLRFYHDGMGQDTYPKQLAALDITYEDFEPGFSRPIGVARTSELQLWALDATPSNKVLAGIAAQIQEVPQLVPGPAYLKEAGAFGSCWDLPMPENERLAALEKQLAFYFDFYKKQVDDHRWYGFWNYGDVMHSYDADRHAWKYDVGGFAWDNSELSTDIWLWLYFLRTGRADVFRMAEAMTRHTGEVDVHHIGPFAPLGSRHNVFHWGCSAKQLRISTVANRRYYYYLTADERVGDLMDEQVDAYLALQNIPPGRKLPPGDVQQGSRDAGIVNLSFGTDWGAAAAAWLTQWERTKDPAMLARLKNSMETIAAQPLGFFTGGAPMEIKTGKFKLSESKRMSVSHLSASFGLPETCAELLQAIEAPEFKKAWLQYCQLYNATEAEQTPILGRGLGRVSLRQSHSRLTAYAAWCEKDPELAKRAWKEFGEDRMRESVVKALKGSVVLNPIEEVANISTNGVAQWCLSAMECMAYIKNYM
jgi:hypothetical protein